MYADVAMCFGTRRVIAISVVAHDVEDFLDRDVTQAGLQAVVGDRLAYRRAQSGRHFGQGVLSRPVCLVSA
jgi:hypothetical protein